MERRRRGAGARQDAPVLRVQEVPSASTWCLGQAVLLDLHDVEAVMKDAPLEASTRWLATFQNVVWERCMTNCAHSFRHNDTGSQMLLCMKPPHTDYDFVILATIVLDVMKLLRKVRRQRLPVELMLQLLGSGPVMQSTRLSAASVLTCAPVASACSPTCARQ